MATKVLFCLVVIAILMSTIPVSVSASYTSDTVIFEGEVTQTGGFIGFTYWDVNVDEWLKGSLICDEIEVILESREPWGSYDSNIRVGDSVQVYGVVNPRGEDPPFCTVGLNGLVYYIKKIGSQGETKPTHPSPKIVEVKFPPACIKEDEYATISVTVENNGGASSEGYISVSFPNGEDVSVVSGTEDETIYPIDSWIWNSKGEQIKSVDPLVELFVPNWDAGESHKLTMNVKPNSGSNEIVFYARAALKNDADGSYERDPNSGYKDQQGWYAEKHSVDVCEVEEVKFRGEILADHLIISFYSFDVKIDEVLEDPTGNLQEGETVNVYGHRDGPAHVDDVTVGDEVEVFGEYRVGAYKQIFLSEWGESSSDHYVKKISRFDLVVTDISFSRLPYEKEPVTITATVTNNGNYGKSNVHVTFCDGYDEIGYKVINSIPAHLSATASIPWDPEKSFEPTKNNNYYTNNIKASVNGEPYFKGVTVGDSGWIGYTHTRIKNSELPIEVPYSIFGQLFLFDSKGSYIGIKEIKGLSESCNRYAPELLEAAAELCMAEITISALLLHPHVGIALCLKGLLPAAIAQVAANLLSHISKHWSDQVPYSYAVGPSPDGNIQIMHIVSFNVISEHEKKKTNQFYSDYYYKNKNGEWKSYYSTREDITYMSSNQILATIKCPANLHAYDSKGRHVGVNALGAVDLEIPGAYYFGPDYEPESVVLLNQSGEITFEIKALDVGEFDFTLMQSTDTKTTTITHLDVPITQTTVATVAVSKANPAYTMEIDNNGDGTTDYTKEPDSIDTIGAESPTEQKVEEIGGTPSGGVTGLELWVRYNGAWTKDPTAIDYGEWTYMLLYLDQGQMILMEETNSTGYVTTKDLGYLSPGYHYYKWIADALGWHKIVADGSITGQCNEIFIYVRPV